MTDKLRALLTLAIVLSCIVASTLLVVLHDAVPTWIPEIATGMLVGHFALALPPAPPGPRAQ